MNVNLIQSNSTQSFGMAFRVKGDGAKKLAETFVDAPNTEKYVMKNIIKPIQDLKTEVIFDGENAVVKTASGREIDVFPKEPVAMPNNAKDIQYVTGDGVYQVVYSRPKNIASIRTQDPTVKMLFNAKEIAKDIDAKMVEKAYTKTKNLSREEQIEQKAKQLQDLFG